jgi:hypothetical protein
VSNLPAIRAHGSKGVEHNTDKALARPDAG